MFPLYFSQSKLKQHFHFLDIVQADLTLARFPNPVPRKLLLFEVNGAPILRGAHQAGADFEKSCSPKCKDTHLVGKMELAGAIEVEDCVEGAGVPAIHQV